MSFDAPLYQRLHQGNPGDIAFYVTACAGGTVLELGCGAGRVFGPLLDAGCTVTGIDSHAGMLESGQAVAKAGQQLTLIHGDMRTFDLAAVFDRIIVPYNGMYCLETDAGVTECLRAIRHHLAPDGLVLFDGYHVDLVPDEAEVDPPVMEWLLSLHDGTRRVDVYESDEHLPATRDCHVTYRHQIIEDGINSDTIEYTLRHHYFMAEALPKLLAAAGLELVSLHGGFNGEPLTDDSELMVVTAQASR